LAVREYAVQVLEVERFAHFNMPQEVIFYDADADPLKNSIELMDVLPSKLPPGMLQKQQQNQSLLINPIGH
jgi:hypothetical protein